MDFPPRPPLARGYRPDTVADGWASGRFAVRAASVRGYLHRFHGTPRQDDLALAVHPGTGTLVLAIADGVSSAVHAHVGAAVVCRFAVESLLDVLDGIDGDGATGSVPAVDWVELLRGAAWALVEQAQRHLGLAQPDPASAEETMSTTLLAGLVRPAPGGGIHATLVQIGDASAWLLHEGTFTTVICGKPDEVLPSTVMALPRVPPSVAPVEITVPPDGVLLIGTDGLGDAIGSGGGELGALFVEHLATAPPPPLGLAHLLDFSRETFDDDRTLVAIWPQAG